MSRLRTVLDVVQLATGHLQASGASSPRLDAEVLLGHVLGLERIQLYVQHDRPLDAKELEAYRAVTARRAKGEPVAYIVGEREFYSRSFKVDKRVLVPRPETELLVDTALEQLRTRFPSEEQLEIADIGTGSGAIAVTIACLEERARLIATDVSPQALEVAAFNAERHGVRSRVKMLPGDLYAPLAGKRFHAIVSNPPYIKESEYLDLAPDVRDYEPRGALVAGEDGLVVIRRLIQGAPEHLAAGGPILLEIGWEQGRAVREIAQACGLVCAQIVQDLEGRDRVAVIEVPEGSGA